MLERCLTEGLASLRRLSRGGATPVDVQNTIVDKGGIKVMLELCKFSERKALPVLANACRALFHLAKNSTNGIAESGAVTAPRWT